MRARAIVRCALFAACVVTSRAQRTPSGAEVFPNVASPSPGTTFSLAPAAAAACQRTVFAGLAVDCNLNDGGSYDACCDRLAVAERALCFCDGGIVATVEAVIGEAGLDFFRAFAQRQCGATLTEASACPSSSSAGADPVTPPGVREPVTTAQTPAPPEDDYDDPPLLDDDGTPQTPSPPTPLATQQQPTPIPFPIPSPPTPAASTLVPSPSPSPSSSSSPPPPAAPGVPGFPPSPSRPTLITPPVPEPPVGPGPAPQLSIPPPAPQTAGSPPRPPDPPPSRRKIPGLPTAAELLSGKGWVNREVGFFADALVATGLLGLLASPGPFTVFAPSNRAWYRALSALGATKEDVFEDPALTEVMLYHVARGETYTSGMFFGQKVPTLHTSAPSVARAMRDAVAAGEDPSRAYLALTEGLEVEVFQTILRKAYFVNGCDVTRANAQASNAVIHVVDCVLLPPSPQPLPTRRTVAQVIVERFELSIFEQALTGGGLLRAVDQASPTNPLTVFAPTNTAFVKYIATNPGFFIDTPQERAVNPGVPGLQETLLYHFVPARLQSGQLETRLGERLRTFEGNDLFVESFHGFRSRRLFVNGCRVRTADIVCADGVVHTLDCVATPNFRDDPDKFFADAT